MKKQYGLPNQQGAAFSLRWLYPVFLMGNMLAASWWATQSIAAGYGWHPGLGKPLLGRLYAPWNWWSWQQRIPDTQGIIDQAVTQGQFAFLIPQLVVLMLLFTLTSRPKGRDDLHGSAHWATPKDIRRSGLLNGKGVVVGGWLEPGGWLKKDTIHYLRHNGPEHLMLFAPTRSGKGVSVVLPTLLSWPESVLVLDIKGENWALTSGWRKQQGHITLRFDPSDPSGTSACFNPLEEVRLETLFAIPDVQNIAMMIVDPDGHDYRKHKGQRHRTTAQSSTFAGSAWSRHDAGSSDRTHP